jgi:mono/diheme cytochrome c family protein
MNKAHPFREPLHRLPKRTAHVLFFWAPLFFQALAAQAQPVDFLRDVQPIFQRACYRCHGPEKQKSGYRLDVREVALKGGELYAPNIVPGKPNDSPLIQFISGDGALDMPPEGQRLSAEEIATLRAWIEQGAAWPDSAAGAIADKNDWWAWKPLTKPAVPDVSAVAQNARVANPIDNFIVAELHKHNLHQAPQADRGTLIRRVYFDLTGLPPSPADVDAFIADDDPHAYERVVDRLLASPRYGERWARHWMDAAHFAETHGHDQDRIREHAWPYRDYLIAAFNSDKPYARFIQEQVAADALFPNEPQTTVALGFLAAGPWDESSMVGILEDTLDRQIARYIDRDDMLSTVMNNVVSLTVQCARCHDHKFDPISQSDYYALQAVFAGVERANRTYDDSVEVRDRRQALLARQHDLENPTDATKALITSKAALDELARWESGLAHNRVNWTPLDPETFAAEHGSALARQADLSLLASGALPDVETYTVTANAPLEHVTALRLELLPDDSLPHHGPGRQPDNGNLHVSEIEAYSSDALDHAAPFSAAAADFNQTDWNVKQAIDGAPQTSWGVFPEVGKPHEAVFEFKTPLAGAEARRLKIVVKQLQGRRHTIGRFRLSVTDAAPPVGLDVLPSEIASLLNISAAARTPEQTLALALHFQKDRVLRELAALPPPSLIYAAASHFEPDGGLKPPPGPRPVHVLHRGDIAQPRELASPGALSCVGELSPRFAVPDNAEESQRRAALAHWLIDLHNPLTWRSIVNRVWHHHFGAGLVATPNDFGHMGGLPSHPELLDWLAATFRDEGGSLKTLHRLIVTSETYRQSSRTADFDPAYVAQASTQDADNRLLWRMNRTRLDAECIHDAVLAAAGRLDLRMGGPSDRQFTLTKGVQITPMLDYHAFDVDSDAARRRSVYRFLYRTLPDPLMDALDCPAGDQITPVRTNSVTVQQALALWNSAFTLRNAEHLAERLSHEAQEVDAQVALATKLLFGRPPTESEHTRLAEYATKYGLPNLCRLLLNANEFVFVD